jgi:hypothetical protein
MLQRIAGLHTLGKLDLLTADECERVADSILVCAND